MSEMPHGPWENFCADFCGPLLTGDYPQMSTHYIQSLRSSHRQQQTTSYLISQVKCPKVIKTDYGPPFNSFAIKKYVQHMGFYIER